MKDFWTSLYKGIIISLQEKSTNMSLIENVRETTLVKLFKWYHISPML